MGYEIEDASGKDLGPGLSISGWAAMKLAMKEAGGKRVYPALDAFAEAGWTSSLLELSAECSRLGEQASDKDVRKSFTLLAEQARRASEFIALVM